jgi:DNA-binding ferritin-like protein (Dps family)
VDDVIDETIGVSSNNKDWKIHEYKNHQLNKEYEREYDTIKFDIKNDLLETGTCKAGRTCKSVARSYIENE